MNYTDQILEGDCLELMATLPSRSIDLILCDLPYGLTHNSWDKIIPFDGLWSAYRHLLKPTGTVVLTGQGAFTAKLIMSNLDWFRYKITWIKSRVTNFMNAKKQPLRKHEDICVFYPGSGCYVPQMRPGEPYDRGVVLNESDCYRGFRTRVLKNVTGDRYPLDVIGFEEADDYVYFKTAEFDGPVYHATQKPVDLGRYLVRTYSKPGDTVLDNACGSGSFLVAAKQEGRHFIGIEQNRHRNRVAAKQVDLIEVCHYRLAQIPMTYEND